MSSARTPRLVESWPQTIAAFVCFGGLLCVLYAVIYVIGPDLDLLVGGR